MEIEPLEDWAAAVPSSDRDRSSRLLHVRLLHGGNQSTGSALNVGDVLPEFLPELSFRLRELLQGVRSAHIRQIRVSLPVMHVANDSCRGADLIRLLIQQATPLLQVGPQPLQGQTAQVSTRLVVE